jgi:glutathione S-transferase
VDLIWSYAMTTPHLLTIGPSHYCEKVRWALELARIAYTEEAHAPIFHILPVKRASGQRSTPVLVVDGQTLTDSTRILSYLQQRPDAAWRPYPADAALAAEALALEERFDERLGPHTRRLAYWHLLPSKSLTCQVMSAPALPAHERALVPLVYPLAVVLLRKGLNITDASAQRSRERVEAELDYVSGLLADGRRYLVGDSLSAADLTLAALAAPMLLPPEYSWPLPPLDAAPLALRDEVARLRATPAGQHIMRLYEEERVVS